MVSRSVVRRRLDQIAIGSASVQNKCRTLVGAEVDLGVRSGEARWTENCSKTASSTQALVASTTSAQHGRQKRANAWNGDPSGWRECRHEVRLNKSGEEFSKGDGSGTCRETCGRLAQSSTKSRRRFVSCCTSPSLMTVFFICTSFFGEGREGGGAT